MCHKLLLTQAFSQTERGRIWGKGHFKETICMTAHRPILNPPEEPGGSADVIVTFVFFNQWKEDFFFLKGLSNFKGHLKTDGPASEQTHKKREDSTL